MTLHIVTWRWGTKYPEHYVDRLRAGVARHLKQKHTFTVMEPHPDDRYLTNMPGCFCRLRAFDPEWQTHHWQAKDDRIVNLDLDLIVTGPLDSLFDRPEPFVILGGANSANPCPYNGSVWMFRAGYHKEIWSDFNVEAATYSVKIHEFPDDQGWFAHKIPDAAVWRSGSESGIYAFKKTTWPKGDDLPKDAKIVAFPGHRDPAQFTHLPWVQEHWRA